MPPIKPVFFAVCAAIVAGCTTSTPAGVGERAEQEVSQAARSIVGTSLVGANGATPADQDAIDDTAAGLCAAKVWTPSECQAHGAR